MEKAKAYILYIDDMEIPITPAVIKQDKKSQNDFYSLVNGETYTALRKPKLDEWSFAFYAFLEKPDAAPVHYSQEYIKNKLKNLKDKKTVFDFIVIRASSSPNLANSICAYMTLEDYNIEENADYSRNILITLNLKEYQPLITKKLVPAGNDPEKRTAYVQKSEANKISKPMTVPVDGENLPELPKENDLSAGFMTEELKKKL